MKQGQPYFQIHRDGRYSDGELMRDLIQQILNLGIDADLRQLRRSLLDVTDGTIVPLPLIKR